MRHKIKQVTKYYIHFIVILCLTIACQAPKTSKTPLWRQLILTPIKTHQSWGGQAKCVNHSPFLYAPGPRTRISTRAFVTKHCGGYTKANTKPYRVSTAYFHDKKPILIQLKLNSRQPMNRQTIQSILGVDPGVGERFICFYLDDGDQEKLERMSKGTFSPEDQSAMVWRNLPPALVQQQLYRIDAVPTKGDPTQTDHLLLYVKSDEVVMDVLKSYYGDFEHDLGGVTPLGILPASRLVHPPRDAAFYASLNAARLTITGRQNGRSSIRGHISRSEIIQPLKSSSSLPKSITTMMLDEIESRRQKTQKWSSPFFHLSTTRSERMEVLVPLLHAMETATKYGALLPVRNTTETHIGPIGVLHVSALKPRHEKDTEKPWLFINLTVHGIALSYRDKASQKEQHIPPTSECAQSGQTFCIKGQVKDLRAHMSTLHDLDKALHTFGSKRAQLSNQQYIKLYAYYDWAKLRSKVKAMKQRHPELGLVIRTGSNIPAALTFHLLSQVALKEPHLHSHHRNILFQQWPYRIELIPKREDGHHEGGLD